MNVQKSTTITKPWSFGTIIKPSFEYIDDYEYQEKRTPITFRKHLNSGKLLNAMDQKHCGGCWSFAINGCIADKLNILYDINRWVSPQYLLSCDENWKTKGCGGTNDVETAAMDLEDNGTYFYNDYPFDPKQGMECDNKFLNCPPHTNPCNIQKLKDKLRVEIKNIRKLNSHEEIKEALLEGPVVTTMVVIQDFLEKDEYLRKGGIYQIPEDNNIFVGGHAIMIVGYDEDKNGRLYWIIKNSWGVDWGMAGYFYCYADQPELRLTNLNDIQCIDNGFISEGKSCITNFGISENAFMFDIATQYDLPLHQSIESQLKMHPDQAQTYKTLRMPIGTNVNNLPKSTTALKMPSKYKLPSGLGKLWDDIKSLSIHHWIFIILLIAFLIFLNLI